MVTPQSNRRTAINTLLTLTAGVGVAIFGLQVMAIMGQLREPWILTFLAVGLMAAGLSCAKTRPQPASAIAAWWSSLSVHSRGSLILLGLVFVSTMAKPMAPPLGGDEAMYHLPHAKVWADSGALDINGWLRYPWFPYNFNIPFAAALLLYDDVFTHLLAALPGWLCAGLVFQVAQRFTGIPGASIASILWLQASRDHYAHGGNDLGVTLFVFAAYASSLMAKETPQKSRWIMAAAFFLGIACGGKYQALSFVPLLVMGVWFTDRSPRTVIKAVLAFLLPCAYWYLRNALMTGDPFQPMGGRIFGFTDWNLADYLSQFADLKRQAGWPEWYLWSILLIPLFRPLRTQPYMKGALVVCAYGLVFWLATSHYPRYLLPLYPLLCILSVVAWTTIFKQCTKKLTIFRVPLSPKSTQIAWLALLVIFLPFLGHSWIKGLAKVAPTAARREALFQERIPSYAALTYVKNNPSQKIYQYGLDDAIYYSSDRLYGDFFGPWRYADYVNLPARGFAQKLIAHGFDTFISRNARSIESQPDFVNYFYPVFTRNGVTVYRVHFE